MEFLNPNQIFYPVFAMVALVYLVMFYMLLARKRAVESKQISFGYYRVFQNGTEPPEAAAVSRNYANLFESPVLFYTVIVFFYILLKVDALTLGLAWAYVILRYIHTMIHLGGNNIKARMVAFALSQCALLALWVKLFCLVRT